MDSRIISNLLYGRNSLIKKGLLVVKMTRFSKVWKIVIFKHFAKPTYGEAKLSTMADFVDEIEIDKIRNTVEIFPFMAKFVFLWTPEIALD